MLSSAMNTIRRFTDDVKVSCYAGDFSFLRIDRFFQDKTKLKRTSGTTEDATGLVFPHSFTSVICPILHDHSFAQVFGAPLKPFAADIPVVLKSVVEYFNFYGVAYEGLFRLSGSQNEIFQYRVS